MARARERESKREERGRNRPPRMTGPSLLHMALLGGLVAVVAGVVGVLMAGMQEDPVVDRTADSLGAALAGLLTAPEPEWWSENHGTVLEDMIPRIKQLYDDEARENWPKIPAETGKTVQGEDWKLKQRNKDRLVVVDRVFGLFGAGALQGLMIRSSDTKRMGNQSVGAFIDAAQLATQRRVGDVNVGLAMARQPGGGTFQARVYHREYKDAGGKRVGDAYVILGAGALESQGGAGIWLFLTPLLVALGVALFVFAAAKTSEGMRTLSRDLDTIGRGRLDLRIATKGSGEVGFLQKTAERMAKNLQLIQTTGSGDLDEALEKELDLANQIHQGLLPSDPPRIPGYELETLFKVGRDIGGDYHDYVELDERRIAVVLADCSESLRGVPAAMVMAMTRAYLRAAIDPSSPPSEWLRFVNRRLSRDLKSGMAVTAMIVVLDSSSHEATVVSAGHRPLVLWRQGKTATLNPNGIAMGLDIGPVFEKTMEEKKFSFHKNDRIVLYTDGIVTAENAGGEAYGDQRLHESIRKQGPMNSAAFVNFIVGGLDKFLDGEEHGDDITICTLKRMK